MTADGILLGTHAFIIIIFMVVYLLLPALSSRDIVLGRRILAEERKKEAVRKLVRSYRRDVFALAFLFFFVSRPLLSNVSDDGFLLFTSLISLIGFFLVYLVYNRRLGRMKEEGQLGGEPSKVAAKEKEAGADQRITGPGGADKAPLSGLYLLPSFVLVALSFLFTFLSYPDLPERIPSHWNLAGQVDAWVQTSLLSASLFPLTQLFLLLIFGGVYLVIVKARGTEAGSPAATDQAKINAYGVFARAWSLYVFLTLFILQGLFTWMNLIILGSAGGMKVLTPVLLIFSLLVVVAALALGLILGQGGDRLAAKKREGHEGEPAPVPDDDHKWVLGQTLYYNPQDPAVFVAKRVGIGWTVNLARFWGKILLILPLLILLMVLIASFI